MNFSRSNAFSSSWGSGNPAVTVFLDEDETYSDDTLAGIAQDMLCEVGFVFNSNSYERTGKVNMRYFTSAKVELKFIGHVTLAALIALSKGNDISVTIDCKGGNIAGRVIGGVASFDIPSPIQTYDMKLPLDELQAAIGPVSLDQRMQYPVFVQGTSSRLVIFVNNLGDVTPSQEKISELSKQAKVGGLFVVELDENCQSTNSRMFCPLIGVPEDSCSGNAHGLLGFILAAKGLLNHSNCFTGYQGASVGRPGIVNVKVDSVSNTAEIGGQVSLFCSGKLEIPTQPQSVCAQWFP